VITRKALEEAIARGRELRDTRVAEKFNAQRAERERLQAEHTARIDAIRENLESGVLLEFVAKCESEGTTGLAGIVVPSVAADFALLTRARGDSSQLAQAINQIPGFRAEYTLGARCIRVFWDVRRATEESAPRDENTR